MVLLSSADETSSSADIRPSRKRSTWFEDPLVLQRKLAGAVHAYVSPSWESKAARWDTWAASER